MKLLDKNESLIKPNGQVVAITGIRGYVGLELAQYLMANGFKVIGLSRSAGPLECQALRGVSLVGVDYFNEEALNIALAGCDTVIHLAGLAHTRKYPTDEEIYRRSILDVTKMVYMAAQNQGCKKFVFASSVKVYGDTSGSAVLNEFSKCSPAGYYGKYKQLSEDYLRDAARGSGTATLRVRFPPVYGGKTMNSLKYLFWAAAHRIPLPISNLVNVRSILSIENLTKFMLAACVGDLNQETYVLHDVASLTIREIYSQLWLSYHGNELPRWLWPRFPEFLLPYASRKGPLAPLLVPFHLKSNYEYDYRRLGMLDAKAALCGLVAREKLVLPMGETALIPVVRKR